mgnify:CR=1 FL=1
MKLLTLNTHSLIIPEHEAKREIFVDFIAKEQPEVFALQEVNQTASAPLLGEVPAGYYPCPGNHVPLKADNHAAAVAKMLAQRGVHYDWSWLPAKIGYGIYDEGAAVFSRAPITAAENLLLSKSDDYSCWKTRRTLGICAGDVWYYTVHLGWWKDEVEPFAPQWETLSRAAGSKKTAFLLGDFNSEADVRGEGYDLVLRSGWQDTYRLTQERDEGYTVVQAIDGWRGCPGRRGQKAHRPDLVLQSGSRKKQPGRVQRPAGAAGLRPCRRSDRIIKGRYMKMQRSAGILLPISSLPSPYGIGCFSQEAYDFVDWLKEAGQTYWQILPLGVTSYGDSPYQSFSAFAGNPYFISLDALVEEGVLTAAECKKANFGRKADDINYSRLYTERGRLLRLAYSRSDIGHNEAFAAFCEKNKWWLDDFALFMAVKDRFEGKPWIEWRRISACAGSPPWTTTAGSCTLRWSITSISSSSSTSSGAG